MIAARAGVLRGGESFLRRVRASPTCVMRGNYARGHAEALEMLAIDEHGLGEADRVMLRAIIKNSPAARSASERAAAVAEEIETIETIYEPTSPDRHARAHPAWRKATKSAYAHPKERFASPL